MAEIYTQGDLPTHCSTGREHMDQPRSLIGMSFDEKLRRGIRRTVLSLLITVAVLAAVGWVEQRRNADEEYAVYSAYLSEGLLNNAHDWSVGGPVQVVVSDTTRAGGNFRFLVFYMLDGRAQFEHLRTSTFASYLVRNLLQIRVRSRFVLPSRATVALRQNSTSHPISMTHPSFKRDFRAIWDSSCFLA